MKGSKFLMGILVVLIVVLSVMLGMNIKVYMDNKNDTISKNEAVQKESNKENEENLKKEEEVEPEEETLEDWQIECKEEHVPYGYGMCSDAESHRMQCRDMSSTSTSGYPGNRTDISVGIDWYKDECLGMHNGECEDIGEHQAKILATKDAYDELTEFGLDRETVYYYIREGAYHGFQFARFYQGQEDMEDYIYVNSPEHMSGLSWEHGFRNTFEKYKNYK